MHEGELLARAGLGAREGVADDALDAERGVDADLGGHLLRRADTDRAAVADVGSLGAFADDHEVDVAPIGDTARERCRNARKQPGRTQVDVVVELEPQPEQESALQDARRHARVADGAEQDRIMAPDLLEHRVGERLAGRVPPLRAEVVLGAREGDVVVRSDDVEHREGLGGHLGADAVARHDGERVRVAGHGVILRSGSQDLKLASWMVISCRPVGLAARPRRPVLRRVGVPVPTRSAGGPWCSPHLGQSGVVWGSGGSPTFRQATYPVIDREFRRGDQIMINNPAAETSDQRRNSAAGCGPKRPCRGKR